jgi:hypothetical protein
MKKGVKVRGFSDHYKSEVSPEQVIIVCFSNVSLSVETTNN